MVELDKVIPVQKIRHIGIFDFKELYYTCYNWFSHEQYDLAEKNYTEKINPKGREVEIEWDAVRKVSEYLKFQIMVRWRIIEMNDVEVEQDGKKIKLQKGDVEIRFFIILLKDYEHRWEGNSFSSWLRKIYDKYFIKSRIDKYEGKLVEEVNDLIGQAKAVLHES